MQFRIFRRPKATVGEAVVGLVMREGLGQLRLGNMRDEAEMGAGGAQVAVHFEGGKVAVIPSAAEQG